MRGVTVNDVGKLVVILVALLGGIGLAIVGAVEHDGGTLASGTAVIGAALGYVTGNGRLASRVEPPSTMIAPVLSEHPGWIEKDALRALARQQRITDQANTDLTSARARQSKAPKK